MKAARAPFGRALRHRAVFLSQGGARDVPHEGGHGGWRDGIGGHEDHLKAQSAINVLGIVPAVENIPGPRAQKPGDVDGKPWIHLDIAGTSWPAYTPPYRDAGPTGVTVRTLAELAMQMGRGIPHATQ